MNVLLFNFKTAYHVTVSRCSDIKPVRVTLDELGSYGPVKKVSASFSSPPNRSMYYTISAMNIGAMVNIEFNLDYNRLLI